MKRAQNSQKASRQALKVSLITTERNEAEDIAAFIDSALTQSLPPDEIVIADGGSTDGTVEIIQEYIDKGAPLKLVHAPGNRSIGRNAATENATYEHIACSDVGSRLDKDWLKNITQPFRDNPHAMVVSGGFKADPQTFFENVSATLMLNPNDHIDVDTWLPSSRSIAYTKTAWKKAGKYPEHTNFNEDTPFDLALKKAGYKFEDGLKAIVYWRPRPNLRDFYRQYYWYAVGDGIDSLSPDHFLKMYLKYGIFVITLLLGLLILPWSTVIMLALFGLYIARRVIGPWRKMKGFKTFALMALLIVAFDVSQMMGYAKGYFLKSKLKGSKKLIR